MQTHWRVGVAEQRRLPLKPRSLTLSARILSVGLLLCAGQPGTAWAVGLIPQDLDHDGEVDMDDFGLFQACYGGPGIPHNGSEACKDADTDYDGDVDQSDFGVLQGCFSGAGVPASVTCGPCVRPKSDRPVGATQNSVVSGLSTSITVGSSQLYVNYQLRVSPSNTPVGSPVSGTGGTIQLPTGEIEVSTTFNVLAINPLAGCSVQLAGTQFITVTPPSNLNKIGVHVVIGPRNGFGPFMSDCAAAGKPVALVKAVDDFGSCSNAKQLSPQTLTIGRKNDLPSCSWGKNCDLQGFDAIAEAGTSPAAHAQKVFSALKPIWDQNPAVDVWEICNEWSAWWGWQADFYIAMMDLAEANNPPYRIGLYGASGGNPPESAWPDVARACARAKASGNHVLCLHEYALFTTLLKDSYAQYGDSLVLRYRRLYAYLKQHNADCPLALTEVGQGGGGGFVGTPLFVADFAWYDTQLRKDPYVLGCAAWTLGNWSGANFQDALPALTNYIITH